MQFEIPIAQNNKVLKSIRGQILEGLFEKPTKKIITDSVTLSHIFFGKIDTAQFREWQHRYEKTANGILLYKDSEIMSYEINSYIYSGGAHGNSSVNYFVFDLKTGKRLAERDIFKENYEKKIIEILLKKLENEECYKNFYFDALRPNNNFFIDQQGITYFFNSYEIASFACGFYKVFIPFEEISEILKK